MQTEIATTLDNVASTTTTFIQDFTTGYFPWILGLFALMVVIGLVLKVPKKLAGR